MVQVAVDNLPLQRLYHWERTCPDKVFMTQPVPGGVREYTWAQTMDEARRVAAYLKALDYPPGSRIAIMSKNCAHWLMADFAIWMAGHVSVPLYPTLTARSVRQILEHSGAKTVFAGKLDSWDEMRRGIPDGVLQISYPLSPPNDLPTWDEIVATSAALEGQPLRDADELATIVYTSGTTGMPKGVMHSFATLGWCPDEIVAQTGACAEDRVLSYLPLAHVAEREVMEMLALRTGMHVYFCESLDTFLQDLRRARPTLFFSVPRLWVKFQQGVSAKMRERRLKRLLGIPILGTLVRRKVLRQLGLDHVRVAGSGAAPLPAATMNWYRDLGLELLEGYGMTELFGLSHMCRPGTVRVGYVGQVMNDVDCRLSENGEVLIRSPGNTLGYYLDPDKTRELFTEDGYVRTGDRGTIDEMGRLKITGRVKEIFKTSKGKYVAPAPIENKLLAHPAVEACCVTGANRPQPFALLMLGPQALDSGGNGADRANLAQSLAEHLANVNAELDPHEQLQFVVVVSDEWDVENDFLTPTLKIKRDVIDAAYGPQVDGWYSARRPVVWQDDN